MGAFVVTPPEPVVTWEDVVEPLGLEGDTSQKTYVESLIAAAAGHIDGPDGWLGRALGEQVIEARFDNFDCGSIRLPYPPVIEVMSVGYVDAAGVVQTIAADRHEMLGRSLVPVYGASWPSHRWQREAVRVRYRAGNPDGIPAPIKAATLLMVGDLYRFRETAVVGVNSAVSVPMSTGVEGLLSTFRAYA